MYEKAAEISPHIVNPKNNIICNCCCESFHLVYICDLSRAASCEGNSSLYLALYIMSRAICELTFFLTFQTTEIRVQGHYTKHLISLLSSRLALVTFMNSKIYKYQKSRF